MNKESIKEYFGFIIAYFLVPSTPLFYILLDYMHPIIAYFVSLMICGTLLYVWTKRKQEIMKRYRIIRKFISEKKFSMLCKYFAISFVIAVIILKNLK